MLTSLRIAATAEVSAVARQAFEELGPIELIQPADRQALASAQVLIVRGQAVDDQLLDHAPSLRVIARTGAGLDAIDLNAATRRGIPVVYAPGVGALPMAEGALALILAVRKRLKELGQLLVDARWQDRYRYEPGDLAGSVLGIVGLGRVGAEVARLGAGLGMTVIAHESRPGPRYIDGRHQAVPNLSLAELFSRADIISLHCDLNESTRGMVDRELMSHAGPGAILVNASRGEVIDDDEVLLEALDAGTLAGVGLDVYAIEPPPPDHPVIQDPRVICTPHAIGLTPAWNDGVFRTLAADVRRVLDGNRPLHLANPEVELDVALVER